MSTLSDALTAYRICAQAEGRSPRTIQWITSSIRYFAEFLGGDQDISTITANDLRRFIIGFQGAKKYRNHPLITIGPTKAIVIGDGHSRHAEMLRFLQKTLNRGCAVEKAIWGMYMEVNKIL